LRQRPAVVQLRSRIESLEATGHAYAAPVLLARAVLGSAAPFLECRACGEALPEQIESELNGCWGPDYRAVRHHLDLCPACRAIYLDLLETALLAEEGPLPGPLLAVDLSFLEKPSERREKDA
jgi:hypothetical protein